jgi:hypothetical protein
MWWKAVLKWLRERIDIEVELDFDDPLVQVTVTVLFIEAAVIAERFEWTLPLPGMPARLDGLAARRTSVLREGR